MLLYQESLEPHLPPGHPDKLDPSAKVIFILLIIRIHKNYLLLCPVNYYFLIPRLEHSYDHMFHFPRLREEMVSSSLVRRYVDYILLCCPTNVAAFNYGPCMEMKHMYTRDHPRLRLLTKHLQHESTFYNIRLMQMKHLEHMFATYVSSHCNICNIQIKALAT
jgi:hypothetical protein